MKQIKIIAIILFTIILSYSCTSEDEMEDPNNGGNQSANLKVIKSISQSQFGNLNIQLQNDRISRFYSAGTTFYHHVNYDGTDRIQNIQDFNYDYISDSNRSPSVFFNYNGLNIDEITSFNLGDLEFIYDQQNRLEEFILDGLRFQFLFEQGENPIAVLVNRVVDTSQPTRYELTFDDKVNPFYTIWKSYGLPLNLAYGDLPDDTFVFFPNNLIVKENLQSQDIFRINYQYDDEDHPTFYRYTDDQGRTRSGFFDYY